MSWIRMGGRSALVSSRGVGNGCRSGLQYSSMSVCLSSPRALCLALSPCPHPRHLSHRPSLGSWAQPPAPRLLGPPTHLFANFEQAQEPLLRSTVGSPQAAGISRNPGLVPPSTAPHFWFSGMGCPLPTPHLRPVPPALNSFQCLNSFCLYV